MSHVFDLSVREFLKVSASDSPTPGGGSVSALVGSLAAAMVSMVANLTVGKEKYKDVEPEVQEILREIQAVMARLEELTAQDIKEFGNFMDVLKMPKNTEAEKTLRAAKMQEALKSATDTPLEIARVCLTTLELADRLSGIGNKGAISDVGVGAYVAEAALNAVLLSVDINLPMIKDEEYVARAKAERDELVAKARELKEKAVAVVQSRLA